MCEYECVLLHRKLGMTPVLLMSGGGSLRALGVGTSSLLRAGTLRPFERFAL